MDNRKRNDFKRKVHRIDGWYLRDMYLLNRSYRVDGIEMDKREEDILPFKTVFISSLYDFSFRRYRLRKIRKIAIHNFSTRGRRGDERTTVVSRKNRSRGPCVSRVNSRNLRRSMGQ